MNGIKPTTGKSELQDKANELIEQIENIVFKNEQYSDDVMLKTSLDYLKAKLKLKDCDEQVLKRFEELREGALAIANLSFSRPIPVTEEDDIFNYFATLLNHLSQALQLKLYDGESFAAVSATDSVRTLKNRAIELLNFYRFHKIYAKSPEHTKYSEDFKLLDDFVEAADIYKLCIKYSSNPASIEAAIEGIVKTLSEHSEREEYRNWMKENFPIRVITNAQFKLIESEIKYEAITKMALEYDIYSQLGFMDVKNNLEKDIKSLDFPKGLVTKLIGMDIQKVAHFIRFSWDELCIKGEFTAREAAQLSDKLKELNCLTLLQKNDYFMLKSKGLVVSSDIK